MEEIKLINNIESVLEPSEYPDSQILLIDNADKRAHADAYDKCTSRIVTDETAKQRQVIVENKSCNMRLLNEDAEETHEEQMFDHPISHKTTQGDHPADIPKCHKVQAAEDEIQLAKEADDKQTQHGEANISSFLEDSLNDILPYQTTREELASAAEAIQLFYKNLKKGYRTWKSRRKSHLNKVKRASLETEFKKMYELLLDLKKSIKKKAYTVEAKNGLLRLFMRLVENWEMFLCDDQQQTNLTCFMYCMNILFTCLKPEAFKDPTEWNDTYGRMKHVLREHECCTRLLFKIQLINELDMDDFMSNVVNAEKTYRDVAELLKKRTEGTNISKAVGGSASAAGGSMCMTGLALAPGTAGISLIVSGVGLGVSVAGGLVGCISEFCKLGFTKHGLKKVKVAMDEVQPYRISLVYIMNSFVKSTLEASCFLKENKVLQDVWDFGTKFTWQTIGVCSCVDGMVKIVKAAKLISNLNPEDFIQIGSTIAAQAITKESGFCASKLARFFRISSTTTAKTLTIVGGTLSIGLGLYDVFRGTYDCINGEPEVDKLLKEADVLRSTSDQLVTEYQSLIAKLS